MDRIGDAAPSFDLTVGIDAGRAGIAVAADRDRRCLGNDQSTLRCALGIIFDHQVARNVAWTGPHSRQRRHHDTVGELIGANLDWREQLAQGCFLQVWMRTADGRSAYRPTRRLRTARRDPSRATSFIAVAMPYR